MGAFSNDLETKLLNYTLRGTGYTAPTATNAVWVALCTADPSETAANECGGTNYARQRCVFGAASTSSIIGPTATVTWTTAGNAWGTIHGYALFDASTAGNYLYYANLATEVAVTTGDKVEFSSNAIIVTLD